MVSTETLLELKNVKYYVTNYLSGSQINIISDLSLKIKSGQITSIMGKSGSGKSTLGKIIANLLNASEGEVIFSTKEPKVSMVFQEFALVPWLSALGNVKLGLSSLPYSESEKEKRAVEMLELVGLESYQNSYPKELSGGMKQRVSIARAIASSPDILVMDEPFASLDLLTTEALRNDFMDLWQHNLLPVKSIVLIAHATEDIAQMSDRVLFLSGSPSNITNEIVAKNKAPREENSEEYNQILEKIFEVMAEDLDNDLIYSNKLSSKKNYAAFLGLIPVSFMKIKGFIDLLSGAKLHNSVELKEASAQLEIDENEMISTTQLAKALGLIKLDEQNIKLTTYGKGFATADQDSQRAMFGSKIKKISIAHEFMQILYNAADESAAQAEFIKILSGQVEKASAKKLSETVVRWLKDGGIIV